MTRLQRITALSVVAASVVATLVAESAERPSGRPKKVLVELFSSQGCDSCPAAEQLLGKLAAIGYGPDRIVPITFHVDYFNDPWKDPFSDVAHSRREMAYNEVLGRKDLYFTPMMMVDGRYPMLGSDRPKAEASIERALKEPPGAALTIGLDGSANDPRRKELTATVSSLSADAAGRELFIGVAVFEDPVSTDVPSGENAGKTLIEHFAVRKFVFKSARLGQDESKTLTFPLELGPGWDDRHVGLAVFVQDWKSGRVYQADSVPWSDHRESTGRATKRGSLRRR